MRKATPASNSAQVTELGDVEAVIEGTTNVLVIPVPIFLVDEAELGERIGVVELSGAFEERRSTRDISIDDAQGSRFAVQYQL